MAVIGSPPDNPVATQNPLELILEIHGCALVVGGIHIRDIVGDRFMAEIGPLNPFFQYVERFVIENAADHHGFVPIDVNSSLG